MIGIDTNVLIRFLTQDDQVQAPLASDFVAKLTAANPGFIGREVMVETVWVLERAYKLPRDQIATVLETLLEAQELVIEAADQVAIALNRYRNGGAGFADQMISLTARAAGCQQIVSFDRKAAAHAEMVLIGSDETH